MDFVSGELSVLWEKIGSASYTSRNSRSVSAARSFFQSNLRLCGWLTHTISVHA